MRGNMTRQQRKHRELVKIEKLAKHLKLNGDRYKTQLTIKGKHYYEYKYGKVVWSLLHSLIIEV